MNKKYYKINNNYKFSKRYLNNIKWKTSDGKLLSLKNINIDHFNNIINYLHHRDPFRIINSKPVGKWYHIFKIYEKYRSELEKTSELKVFYQIY